MTRFEKFSLEELEDLRYGLSRLFSDGDPSSESEKLFHEIEEELSKRE